MRIKELVREDRVDEFLPAVGAAIGGLARGAAAIGQGTLKGAQAVGNMAVKGAQAAGQAVGQAAKTPLGAIQKSISAAGSAGEKILANPKGIGSLPMNQITKAMGIPNQGALTPDQKKAFGLEKMPGNFTVKSVNGQNNKDSVELDNPQLGAPIALDKNSMIGVLQNVQKAQAQDQAQQAEKDAQAADRTSIQASTGGAGAAGASGSTGGVK
jgi:hypothetical protein